MIRGKQAWSNRLPDEPNNPITLTLERKLATILSADVAEFSRLMGEDEEQTLKTFRGHKQVFESLVAMHRGRIFNTAGDAILAEFNSAVEAVRCATDIQAALRTRNDQLPPSRQVRFRIGINLGDVMVHGQDLLGDGVNVAARLQTAAEPGGICISGSVHDQISNKLSLSFQSLGEMNFKNIQRPVRTFSITEAEGRGALPSPKPRGAGSSPARWIVAGVLILAAGGYWTYDVNQRNKIERARAMATAAQPAVAQPEVRAPEAPAPAAAPPEVKTTEAPRVGRYDGVYSGPICYGETKKLPERCYQAGGTIRGNKIASQWIMGHDKKANMVLAGDVTRSGDVTIEIDEFSQADGSRQATIDLAGTVHGGLINASGSFRRGRPARLNWHKISGGSH
jgi:class 3 adenylate cyclase